MSPKVTRAPVDARYKALGNANRPGEEYFLLVGDVKIGGTYWCGAGDVPGGQKWASWGVGGLSMRHRTRELAEQAQVDAYRAGVSRGALDRVARARGADDWCWR
jgi:hypothetical protein